MGLAPPSPPGSFEAPPPQRLAYKASLCPQRLEHQIADLPPSLEVGSILCDTDDLKVALTQECRLWKRAFGSALHRQASASMDQVLSSIHRLTKQLRRPITDLEDVRAAMAALREVGLRLTGRGFRL